MRNAAPHVEGNFGRRHINLAIHLNGIAVDNLAAETQRNGETQIALARSGRPDDGDDRVLGCG